MTRSYFHPRRGFTVLELMTALLICMVMGAIAMSGFFIYEKQLPLDKVTRQLVYAMSLGRTHAIAQDARFAFQLDVTGGQYWLDELDDADAIAVPKVQRPESIDPKTEILSVYSGAVQLYPAGGMTRIATRFFPDGSCDDLRILVKLKEADGSLAENVHTVRLYGPTGQSKVFAHQILLP